MPDFTVQVSFEVFCGECGAGLCNQSDTEERYGRQRVTVSPCEKCLGNAEDNGYEKGYKVGFDDGVRENNDQN